MKHKLYFFSVALFAMAMCGCSPYETEVAVKASTLKHAAGGAIGYAGVKMTFDAEGCENLQETVNDLKRVALSFLGNGGTIEPYLDGKTIVTKFNIPVGTQATLNSVPQSILWLRYSESARTFELVRGNSYASLNSALGELGLSFEYECCERRNGRGTVFRIDNDAPVKLGVTSAEVNGGGVVSGTVDTGATSADRINIRYDNEYYIGRAPCFSFAAASIQKLKSPEMNVKWPECSFRAERLNLTTTNMCREPILVPR